MIELEDPVVNLNLGVNEYGALKLKGIETIRQLLLFDVDKLIEHRQFSHTVAPRIVFWQKLLRKYLMYDKLHDARSQARLAQEPQKIHDSIDTLDIPKKEISTLKSLGIEKVLDFVEADITKILSGKAVDGATNKSLQEIQDRFMRRNIPEEELEPEINVRNRIGRRYRPEEPVVVLTPEEFLDTSITEAGLCENELSILQGLSIATVRDFVKSDITVLLEKADIDDKKRVAIRLTAWRKYLVKILKVSKK